MIPSFGIKTEEEIFARDDNDSSLLQTTVEFTTTDWKILKPEPEKKCTFTFDEQLGLLRDTLDRPMATLCGLVIT